MAKILIVEDEVQLAEAYAFLFRKQGHKVVTACDGEDGLAKVYKAKPDIIVLDMMMPNLDGLGFLRSYDTTKHPETKIILLSNMQSHEHEKEAYRLGATRYEIKASLSPPQLLAIVEQTLI